MNDPVFNVKFVEEVEKHNVLYNYRLPGYSKKNEVDKAWYEVSAQVNLPVSECREKWKNLRTVFMRKMKTPASGSGATKKPYYLENAMQFCLPFIKTNAPPSSGNYPPVPSPTDEVVTEDAETSSNMFQMDVPGSLASLATAHSELEPTIPNKQTSLKQPSSSRKKESSLADTDKCVAEYFQAKKALLELNAGDPRQQSLKMFLFSLLPELLELSDHQIKMFKRQVFTMIDRLSTSSDYQEYDAEPDADTIYVINQVDSPKSASTTGTVEYLE